MEEAGQDGRGRTGWRSQDRIKEAGQDGGGKTGWRRQDRMEET